MRTDHAPRSRKTIFIWMLLTTATILSSGCASFQMNAWDRDLMARKSMQLNTHPIITAADSHIYFSKEGSSGGRTFDGGGCGCN